jgi:hypothetical protein
MVEVFWKKTRLVGTGKIVPAIFYWTEPDLSFTVTDCYTIAKWDYRVFSSFRSSPVNSFYSQYHCGVEECNDVIQTTIETSSCARITYVSLNKTVFFRKKGLYWSYNSNTALWWITSVYIPPIKANLKEYYPFGRKYRFLLESCQRDY